MLILLTGWPSFLHGEATAGDVLSMDRVQQALQTAGLPVDVAWSPVFRPGALHLADADPERYTHLVFVCGPAHGSQVRWLHERFPRCRRVAVGVTVVDPDDPAVTGFHQVLARDGGAGVPSPRSRRDVSSAAAAGDGPVVGVVLAAPQPEYGKAGRHAEVHEQVTRWLTAQDCTCLPVDTRLDRRDWRHATTPGQLDSLLTRLDTVVTTRLHGMVLALRLGVPALAVDPVAGAGKVSAQACAWQWPALVCAEDALRDTTELDRWWPWCLSPEGRAAAAQSATAAAADEELVTELLRTLAATR
jgi:hypothetical protein